MKLFAGLVATTTALSDEEFAAFKCRPGTFYQYGKGDGDGNGAIEWNEVASAENGWAGCFPDQPLPCYRTDAQCEMETDTFTANNGIVRHTFSMNSIPDHHAWGMSGRTAFFEPREVSYRLPKAPVLLSEAEGIAQGAGAGTIGFAINGVAMYKPYNSNCCDAVYDELLSMDHCMGHPGQGHYHYHFLAYGDSENAYDGCLMSCNGAEVGGIVGIALDGFPFYGPMQYYSASEGKVYNDPRNCDDCELTQLNAFHTDKCGGIEVADGDESEGGQYRYIISNLFPYNLQCWRGDMSKSQQSNPNGDYRKISFSNKCGVDSEGIQGGTWDDEEHGWRGGGCSRFDPDWVTEYGCTAGDCPYNFNDFRNGIGYDFGYPKASWSTFSEVYFKCTAAPSTVEPTTTEGTTTLTTTTAGTLATEPVTINIDDDEPVDEEDDMAPAPVGEAGRWQRCPELEGVFGGNINCAVDLCTLTCMDGTDPMGPPKARCLKDDDGNFSWNKELGSCRVAEPEPTTTRPRSTTTPEITTPRPTSGRPTTPMPTTPMPTTETVIDGDDDMAPAPQGEPGKWQRCEVLNGVFGGEINCAADLCVLTCMDGSDPMGPPKTKCMKDADGNFNWNKDLGSCPISDEVESTTTAPRSTTTPEIVTTPESTSSITEPEVTRPEAPSPVGEDGKWQKCEELAGVMGGSINCAVDVCVLTCDDGSDPDGSPKTKCIKNADKTFQWNKDLGTCPVNDDSNDGDDEEPVDEDKPVEEVGPAPTGEDGKWQKCEGLDGVVGGKIKCAADTCVLKCDDGSDPEGSAKAKCIKNADKTFTWNKDLGTCSAGNDDAADENDDAADGNDDAAVGPAPTGEDGKWQKCDALDGVSGGKIKCAVDTCVLKCDSGADPEGSAKTKCIKNADKTFTWNKDLGTCSDSGNDTGDETGNDTEEVDDANPGCKDVNTMITDENLSSVCKLNDAGKYQCKLQCADGLLFNGKKGKTNTKVYCKCKNGVCKWQNDNKKVINKATMSGYTCE